MAILKPLPFKDRDSGKEIKIATIKALRDHYKTYPEAMMKFIENGEMDKFLAVRDDTIKNKIAEEREKQSSTKEIYKALARTLGIELEEDSIPECHIVSVQDSLKDALEKGNFPKGTWGAEEGIEITSSRAITGMGRGETVLRIAKLGIDIPEDETLEIKGFFFRNCLESREESVIEIKRGKVLFEKVDFERVRVEASGNSYVKMEDCKFELLNQPALTENDNGRIVCGENIKYDKCSKPHLHARIDASTEISDENIESYLHAAEKEDALAQYKLGEYYFNIKNYKQAVEWFRKAAEQGNVEAQYKLGNYYFDEEDYKDAVQWYLKAAEQGHMAAQCKLGECYRKGHGVNTSADECLKWLRKSAEQGYAQAQYELGKFYSTSYYGFYDRFKAVELYLKSAEQGYVEAQYKIAECYINGDGVDKDKSQGEKWYKEFLKGAEELPREDFKYSVRRGYYDTYDIGITNNSYNFWKADIIIEVKIGKIDFHKIKKLPPNLAPRQEGIVRGFPLADKISDFSVKLYRWKLDEKILDILF